MKRRHRELMQQVAAAKPDTSSQTDAWVRSGRASELLDDILATAEETVEPDHQAQPEGEGPPGRTRVPRWSFAAAGTVVVTCAVAFLALYVLPSLGDENRTAVQPSVTTAPGATTLPAPSTTVAAGPELMTKGEALESLIRFADEFPRSLAGTPPLAESGPEQALSSAMKLGMVHNGEIQPADLSQLATRKEFAVWVKRGLVLTDRAPATVPTIVDGHTLSAEERLAAETLVSLGVLELNQQGAFRGDEPLTSTEAMRALDAVRATAG